MSSSLNESKRRTQKSEEKEAEEILQKGVEDIYASFNLVHKNYKEKISNMEKEINNLSQKIETIQKEMEMIQRENKYYKEKNNKLKNEIENLNKIVSNIKGQLTNGDLEINHIFKTDNHKSFNLRKFYTKNNNKFKSNNNNLYLYNTYKNNIYNENKKNEKNKLIHYSMNNKNNSLNFNTDLKKNDEYNSSFDFQLVNNNNFNHNNHTEYLGKYRTPNSIKNKYRTEHISREEKFKRNNYIDISEDLPRDSSNNKNINNSSNKYINMNLEDNKQQDEINDINNEDLNLKELNQILLSNNNANDNNITKNNNKIKKLGQKVCLTYDNLFNTNIKEINKSKNTYNTFRGKIFNKNISEKCIRDQKNKDKEKVKFFLNKCKNLLDKQSAEKIMNVFQDYKEGLITDKGIFLQIKKYIWKNNELIELFNKAFSK